MKFNIVIYFSVLFLFGTKNMMMRKEEIESRPLMVKKMLTTLARIEVYGESIKKVDI